MKRLWDYLRRDLWSPYVAGVMLGLIVILSMWGADHTVGASGAFQNIASYLGLALSSTETTVQPATDAVPAAEDDTAQDEAADFWGAEAEAPAQDAASFWSDTPASDPALASGAETSAPTSQIVAKEGLEGQYTFFAFTSPKGMSWMVWLMVGIFFGALISAVLSGGFRLSLLPHSDQWQRIFGPSVVKRWAIVYAGSVIIAIAAGIAGGCTSGLAIAKGVQLAPAAFLFIMGMFVTGPLTAAAIYRRRY